MGTRKNATNATKTNKSLDFTALYNDLITCKSKYELVATMMKHGYYTTTTPTTTPNTNDLYIQFNDKSRLLIGKKSLKLYTNQSMIDGDTTKTLSQLTFDDVNDGSYRKLRATVTNTVDMFNKLFSVFAPYAVVPTISETK